jgi:hypothetical protein
MIRKYPYLYLLLLLFCTAHVFAQSENHNHRISQQTRFDVEQPIVHPIPIPADAFQTLTKELQDCAEREQIRADKIPASWFTASEINLQPQTSGLVIRDEVRCFVSPHFAKFWVLERLATGWRVVLSDEADRLDILNSRTNGHREIQLLHIVGAGEYFGYRKFCYEGQDGVYRLCGSRRVHHHIR